MAGKLAILKNVIKLAEERNKEEGRIKHKYDIDCIRYPPDEQTNKYLNAPRPKQNELTEYLVSLKKEELIFVATVMYGGRGYLTHEEKVSYDDLYQYLKPQKVAGLINSISEKTPLHNYISAGIEVFNIK